MIRALHHPILQARRVCWIPDVETAAPSSAAGECKEK